MPILNIMYLAKKKGGKDGCKAGMSKFIYGAPKKPIKVTAVGDTEVPDENPDAQEEHWQIQVIIYDLQWSMREPNEKTSIIDADGEEAIFDIKEIPMIKIPKPFSDPDSKEHDEQEAA